MRASLKRFTAAVVISTFSLHATESKSTISIIPKPAHVELQSGSYNLNSTTVIVADKASASIGNYLATTLNFSTGFNLKVSSNGTEGISLVVDKTISTNAEAYNLTTGPNGVQIVGASPAGLFYGVQSFLQLFPAEIFQEDGAVEKALQCPAVSIKDEPRFKWRGMHVDVARHFMPIDFLKRFIDQLSILKMNRMHMHLTEDQGWRIEIKKFPKLTTVGSIRKETMIHPSERELGGPTYDSTPHGGFYTQAQLKDLVKYAEARFVTIMPEIEMPGHSQAALTAYPEFGCTGQKLEPKCEPGVSPHLYNVDDKTFEFLEDILTEVMDIFPSRYIHIGGDEAPKGQWKKSATAQAKMKSLNLTDEEQLQTWFINRIGKFLRKNGRDLVGWQEITHGGTPDGAVVMPWMNLNSSIKAAQEGHDIVIATTYPNYFDSKQSNDPTEPFALMNGPFTMSWVYNQTFAYKELSSEKLKKRVLGAQGQLWSEYMPTPEVMEYQAFSRVTALAEATWSPLETKNYGDFLKRLAYQGDRMTYQGINFRFLDPLAFHNWTADQSSDNKMIVDANAAVTEAGDYIFEFKNTKGKAMNVVSVELFDGNKALDADKHLGIISKANPFNDRYSLTLKKYDTDANYSLKVILEGSRNCDGEIKAYKGRNSWKFLPIKLPEGLLPIHNWDEVSQAGKRSFSIDLTGLAKSTGIYEVDFKHVKGNDLKIKAIKLFRNGVKVGSDVHPGHAGVSSLSNDYALNITDNSGKLTLKVLLAKKVNGSNGSIFLRKSNVLKKASNQLGKTVGTWSPKNLPTNAVLDSKLDVTDVINATGNYEVFFKYTGGANALAIKSVEFWDNGVCTSKDIHNGSTGSRSKDNTYSLKIDKLSPKGRKLIKVKIQGQGGLDTNGDITISKKK